MKTKERFICMIVGAILGFTILLIRRADSPLIAQCDTFGNIIFTRLIVVNSHSTQAVSLGSNEHGGKVYVSGEDGKSSAGMSSG